MCAMTIHNLFIYKLQFIVFNSMFIEFKTDLILRLTNTPSMYRYKKGMISSFFFGGQGRTEMVSMV